jgi:uncharacterized SAM-binding protein YcdF (DUF218 family)
MSSKLLAQLVYPANIVLWLMIVAFVLILLRHTKSAGFSLFLAIAAVFVGSSPIALALYQAHERQYLPIAIDTTSVADAIVLLAGDVGIPASPRVETQIHGNRVIHSLRLYRAGKAPLVIVSGGNVFSQQGLESEAEYTARLLEEFGVPREAIVLDRVSRNTRENALETARLVGKHGLGKVLLVTSAFHMPRAVASFQSVGIKVIPSPSSISAELARPRVLDWIPTMDGLDSLKSLVHEKLGILVYRARGWIN